MNKMAFWNNGTPRIVRVGQLDRVTGRFIGNRPDPDIDLYGFEEVGPTPGRFETHGPVAYANDGWTVTATRSVVAQDAALVAAELKRDVKAKRNQVRDAGIEWNTYVVQTDSDSRREMTGAVVSLNESGALSMPWRMLDNSVVVVAAADFKAMALAVSAHVQACYVRQAELEAALDAAVDPTTVDITVGWPAHYVAPGIV